MRVYLLQLGMAVSFTESRQSAAENKMAGHDITRKTLIHHFGRERNKNALKNSPSFQLKTLMNPETLGSRNFE